MTDHNEAMRLADALAQPGVRYATETEAQAKLRRIKNQAEAAALIRKQAERIAELERLSTGLSAVYNESMDSLRIVVDERDTLRAEVERLRKTDAEILACNYPDGEENGPTVAAPDFDLICFARQLGIIDTARKATQ